jgi:hypothetical protein
VTYDRKSEISGVVVAQPADVCCVCRRVLSRADAVFSLFQPVSFLFEFIVRTVSCDPTQELNAKSREEGGRRTKKNVKTVANGPLVCSNCTKRKFKRKDVVC